MKTLKKIKLTSMAKEELSNRDLSQLLGGSICCICACTEFNAAMRESTTAQANNDEGSGGYGVEKNS